MLQRIDLCDRLTLEPAPELRVEGFGDDTIVRTALEHLAEQTADQQAWRVRLDKKIPVAAGLGGGSADAAAALLLANETLPEPLDSERLAVLAAGVGADVPFFLRAGPKLAEGAGERLRELDLPQDYWVLILLPEGAEKRGTGEVYERFDAESGGLGFDERRDELLELVTATRRPRDFARFPPNDLAEASGTAWLAEPVRAEGAFRADVSGAGPAVYGLFHRRAQAEEAARNLRGYGPTWVVAPVW